jgi:hypothetical protein
MKKSLRFLTHAAYILTRVIQNLFWQIQQNPYGKRLKKFHAKAESLGAPLLSLTCLGIQRSNPAMSTKDTVAKNNAHTDKKNEMAFVAINASDKEVEQAILCRQIFLERRGYSTPEENVQEDAPNVFLFNQNAAKIVRGLGDRHWFVFGRGFQQCGKATAAGLLALGKNVTILEDAILPVGGKWNTPGVTIEL